MQNFLFWNINKLVCHARDQDCPCACLLQQKKILWKKKCIISVPFFERNRLTLLFKITPSHWEYRCRDIVSSVQNATVFLTYSGWGHKSKQVTKPAVRCGPRGFTRLWGLWISGHAVDTKNYSHWRLVYIAIQVNHPKFFHVSE